MVQTWRAVISLIDGSGTVNGFKVLSDGSGTIKVRFTEVISPIPSTTDSAVSGHWTILGGTGTYSNLIGQGTLSTILHSDLTLEATYAGEAHFEPTA